jgi:hypothetical protein
MLKITTPKKKIDEGQMISAITEVLTMVFYGPGC